MYYIVFMKHKNKCQGQQINNDFGVKQIIMQELKQKLAHFI